MLASGLTLSVLYATGCTTGGRAAPPATPAMTRPQPAAVPAADEPQLAGGSFTLLVQGLTCPSCVRQVDAQLRQLPSVREVAFDVAAGTVRVTYDPQRPPRASDVREAVRWGGGVVIAIEQP